MKWWRKWPTCCRGCSAKMFTWKRLLDPALGQVKADQGQIEQVIMNLAVNARDAMPGGGRLLIQTKNVQLEEGFAYKQPAMVPGEYVMILVKDTGMGMDAQTQAHIFEPFFTTKERGKGTGLGLATVYGFVKQSGGYVWVKSEPGVGTTFTIYLPQVPEAAEQNGASTETAAPSRGAGIILLVEDEEMLRTLARSILEQSGYTVLEASDGMEAVDIAREHTRAHRPALDGYGDARNEWAGRGGKSKTVASRISLWSTCPDTRDSARRKRPVWMRPLFPSPSHVTPCSKN